MKKIILMILLIISTQISAKEVRVFATGSYKVLDKTLIDGSMKKYAKKQALIVAKQNAIEQAGTTLYSSIYIANDGQGKEQSVSKLEAISAGIIKTKVLSKKFINYVYTVRIEATIDVADVEAVFNKADKRLKNITKLQKQNAKITKQIEDLTTKLAQVLAHSTSYEINEPKKIFEKQELLVAEYEKNISRIKVRFKKGTLADLANAADGNAVYDELEELKIEWDEKMTKPLMKKISIYIQNVKVKKVSRSSAEINFELHMKTPNFSPKFKSGLVSSIKGGYKLNENYKKIYFRGGSLHNDLSEWINRYRTLVVSITIGDHKYITEPVLFSKEKYSLRSQFSDKQLGVVYLSTKTLITHRKIYNFPIKELKNVSNISAEIITLDNNYLTCELTGPGYECSAFASVNNYKNRNHKLPINIVNGGVEPIRRKGQILQY